MLWFLLNLQIREQIREKGGVVRDQKRSKSILAGLYIVLLAAVGWLTIVACGDGDGETPQEGAVRLLNSITCYGESTVGTLAVGGKTMRSDTSQWSPCRFYPPGEHVARATLQTQRCGTWSWNNIPKAIVANDCTQVYRMYPQDGKPWLRSDRVCPGDCVGSSSLETENADTMEEIAVEGVLVGESDIEYSFEE